VARLKEAGLQRLSVSVDGFHQEFVPFDAVRRAIALAQDGGINVCVHAQAFPDGSALNPFDEQTKALREKLVSEFQIPVQTGRVQMVGRAIRELAKYLPMLPVEEALSAGCYFANEDGALRDPADRCGLGMNASFVIDPYGWVWLCTGIAVGNATQTSISSIIEKRSWNNDELLSTLLTSGHRGLLELGIRKGYRPLTGYASKCHLCFHVRKHLQPFYPGSLAPTEIYQ